MRDSCTKLSKFVNSMMRELALQDPSLGIFFSLYATLTIRFIKQVFLLTSRKVQTKTREICMR